MLDIPLSFCHIVKLNNLKLFYFLIWLHSWAVAWLSACWREWSCWVPVITNSCTFVTIASSKTYRIIEITQSHAVIQEMVQIGIHRTKQRIWKLLYFSGEGYRLKEETWNIQQYAPKGIKQVNLIYLCGDESSARMACIDLCTVAFRRQNLVGVISCRTFCIVLWLETV